MINQIICFYDGSALNFALVLKQANGRVALLNTRKRKFNLPDKFIVAVFPGHYQESNFAEHAIQIEEEIRLKSEDIDIELIFSDLSENENTLDIQEITESYFGEKEKISLCAIFSALSADMCRFKRKGIELTKRSSEEAESLLKAQKIKKDKAIFREIAAQWCLTVLEDNEKSIPENLEIFVTDLEDELFYKRKTDVHKVLEKFCGDKESLRVKIFEILTKINILDKNSSPFLVLAGIEENFPGNVLEAAQNVADSAMNSQEATFQAFTIDDEETQDRDDALSLEIQKDSFILGVHIADTANVPIMQGSIFSEACSRGQSIYLPDRTVNMLPNSLSQNIYSLDENEQRKTLSFIFHFNLDFEMIKKEIQSSSILIQKNFSYTEVDDILESDIQTDLAPKLKILSDLSAHLQAQRVENNALMIDRREVKIRVKEGCVEISEIKRNSPARKMIEEMMILTNVCAAEFARENEIPFIYRVQKEAEFSSTEEEPTQKRFGKTKTSIYPDQHASLGVAAYAQITSPIRRISDMVGQCQLRSFLDKNEYIFDDNKLLKIINYADSAKELSRNVQDEAEQYWKLQFLKQSDPDEKFSAIVLKSLHNAFLVEILTAGYKTKLFTQEILTPDDEIFIKICKVNPEKNDLKIELIK